MSDKKLYVLGFHDCIDGYYAAYRTARLFHYLRRSPDEELFLLPLDYPLLPDQYKFLRDSAKPGNRLAIVDYALSSERFFKFAQLYDQVIFCDHHPKGLRIAAVLRQIAKELIAQKRLIIHDDKTRCGSKIYDDEIILPILREKCPPMAEAPTPAREYVNVLDLGLVQTKNYDQISCYMGDKVPMHDLHAAFRAFEEINMRNDHAYVLAEGQKIIDKYTPRQEAVKMLRNHQCIWLEGLKGFPDDWYDIVFFDIWHPIYGRPLADKACKLSRDTKNGLFIIGHIRNGRKLYLSVRTWKGLPNNGVVAIAGNGSGNGSGNGRKHHLTIDPSLAPDAGLFAESLAASMKELYGITDETPEEDRPSGGGHAGRGCTETDPSLFSRCFVVATQEFARLYPKGPPLHMNGLSPLYGSGPMLFPSALLEGQTKQYPRTYPLLACG